MTKAGLNAMSLSTTTEVGANNRGVTNISDFYGSATNFRDVEQNTCNGENLNEDDHSTKLDGLPEVSLEPTGYCQNCASKKRTSGPLGPCKFGCGIAPEEPLALGTQLPVEACNPVEATCDDSIEKNEKTTSEPDSSQILKNHDSVFPSRSTPSQDEENFARELWRYIDQFPHPPFTPLESHVDDTKDLEPHKSHSTRSFGGLSRMRSVKHFIGRSVKPRSHSSVANSAPAGN